MSFKRILVIAIALILVVAACKKAQPTLVPTPVTTPIAAPLSTTPAPAILPTTPAPTPGPTTPPPTPILTTRAPTPAPPTPATTVAPVVTPTPTTPTETLGDILSRTAGVASVKYDVVITPPGKPPITQKIWLKKNKMRMELIVQGQSVVNLTDTVLKTMISYMPSQNTAIRMDFSQASPSATDSAKSVENYKPTIIGTEILNGKVCLVVEHITKDGSGKMWIWKQYGLPVRSEVTSPEGKTIMEYQNFEFTDIPDSTFDLPAGVQVMSLPTLPSFPATPPQPPGVPQAPTGMPTFPAIPGLPPMPTPAR